MAIILPAPPGNPGIDAAAVLRVRRWRNPSVIALLLAALLLPGTGVAHEAWLLGPDEIAARNAQAKPELFTRLTPANAAMGAAAAAGIVGWLALAAAVGAGRVRFPGARARLAAADRYAPLAVRAGLALTLATAALGLHPRHGTSALQAATLGFPDLELRLLDPGWGWLAAFQLALAAALLLGAWVRAAGAGVLLLTALGLALFGTAMFAYAGAMAGAAAYLALRGGGPLCLPLPGPADHDDGYLERLDRERAQFLVRLLTGATFLWCGLYYKVLQPNLVLAIIVDGRVPTFGLGPEAFVLGMTLVEVAAGGLMTAGVLIRPLALALFVPFMFLSAMLGEDPLGHALFYGNLAALATGGAGRWRPAARLPATTAAAVAAP